MAVWKQNPVRPAGRDPTGAGSLAGIQPLGGAPVSQPTSIGAPAPNNALTVGGTPPMFANPTNTAGQAPSITPTVPSVPAKTDQQIAFDKIQGMHADQLSGLQETANAQGAALQRQMADRGAKMGLSGPAAMGVATQGILGTNQMLGQATNQWNQEEMNLALQGMSIGEDTRRYENEQQRLASMTEEDRRRYEQSTSEDRRRYEAGMKTDEERYQTGQDTANAEAFAGLSQDALGRQAATDPDALKAYMKLYGAGMNPADVQKQLLDQYKTYDASDAWRTSWEGIDLNRVQAQADQGNTAAKGEIARRNSGYYKKGGKGYYHVGGDGYTLPGGDGYTGEERKNEPPKPRRGGK